MKQAQVRIEPVSKIEDYHRCERLQQEVWGFSDLSVIPHHLMIAAQADGGLVLGAYSTDEAGEEQLIGFLFGFPCLEPADDGRRQAKHCSMMCAVLADWRGQGIGYRLKLAQREFARAQGLELITWTFDPLMSANAHFNFAKLGVIARRYERDFYGDLGDRLNRGLPTDRFTVEWWINSPRVLARLAQPEKPDFTRLDRLPPANYTTLQAGLLMNRALDLELQAEALRVEIPRDFSALKRDDPGLAARWRSESRRLFEHYLQAGYRVSEFFDDRRGDRPRSSYILERHPDGLADRSQAW